MTQRYNYTGTGILTGTATAMGTIPADRWNSLSIIISGLATENIQLQISPDGGVTWSGSISMKSIAGTLTTPLTNAAWYLEVLPPCTHVRFVKSAGVDNTTIRYCFRQS